MPLITAQTLPAVIQSLGLNPSSFRPQIRDSLRRDNEEDQVHHLPNGDRLIVHLNRATHRLMLQREAPDGTVLRELGLRETPESESYDGKRELRLFKSFREGGRHIHLQAYFLDGFEERELYLGSYITTPGPKVMSSLTVKFVREEEPDRQPRMLAMHHDSLEKPFVPWPDPLSLATAVGATSLRLGHEHNFAVPFFRELLPDLPANTVGLIFHHPEQNVSQGAESAVDALVAGGQVYLQAQILKAGGGVETPSELERARFGLKDFI